MTTIFLVRHGEFENPQNVYPLRAPGYPLSKLGREQVSGLAEKLLPMEIKAIYSSPILRCHQTGEIISQELNLPLNVDDRLTELLCPFQEMKKEVVDKKFVDNNVSLYSLPEQIEKGEMPDRVVSRMKSVFDEIILKFQDKNVVVVSHGDPIMLLLYFYTNRNYLDLRGTDPDYIQKGGCYELHFEGNKFLSVVKYA